jgi:hypothetical protein
MRTAVPRSKHSQYEGVEIKKKVKPVENCIQEIHLQM